MLNMYYLHVVFVSRDINKRKLVSQHSLLYLIIIIMHVCSASIKLLFIQNMRHISYNDFLASIDNGN